MEDEEKMEFWDIFLSLNRKEKICKYFIKGGLEHVDLYTIRYALPYLKRKGLYNLARKNLKESNLQIEVKDALDFLKETTKMFDFIDITNILMFVYQMQCNNDQKKFIEVVKLLKKIYENNLKLGGTMVLDYMFSIRPTKVESPISKVTESDILAMKVEELYKNIYNALKEEFNDLETLQVTACGNPTPLKGEVDTVVYVRK